MDSLNVVIDFRTSMVFVDETPHTVPGITPPDTDSGACHIQWLDNVGDIEYFDKSKFNKTFTDSAGYNLYVAPFVALWEAEKARQEDVKRTPQQERIAETNARISVIEQDEQPRCLREAALGPDIVGEDAYSYAQQKLSSLNLEIKTLREELSRLLES